MCTGLLGNGYDVLISVVCLVLFLFGFFLSVPTFLIMQFGNREKWKYEKKQVGTISRLYSKNPFNKHYHGRSFRFVYAFINLYGGWVLLFI